MATSKNKKKVSKPTEKPSKREKNEKNKAFKDNLILSILAVLAIFLMVCYVSNLFCNMGDILGEEGRESEHTLGYVGYYICNVSMGLFGYASFVIPVLLLLFVILWNNYNRRSYVAINTVIAFVSAIVVSALVHIFLHMDEGTEAFSNEVSFLYEQGVAFAGGGLMGGFLSFALVNALHIFGAIFVLAMVLLILVLFLMGTTPIEVARLIYAKIKAAIKRSKERAEERRLERAEERLAEKEREKQEKEHERQQEKLDREAEREQEKLDREAARQQEKLDREAEREAKRVEKEALRAAKIEKSRNVAATAEEEEVKCIINLPDYGDEEIPEEEEEETITLKVFSDEELKHIDGIKDEPTEPDYNAEPEDEPDEIDEADIYADEEVETVVFSDPKDKGTKQRGHDPVDDLFNERFSDNEDMEIDTETGEVFTPVVQDKKIKSADEFRAQNEKKEERFIGEKPAPIPIPEYKYPPIDLLEPGTSRYASDQQEIEKNAELLREVLQDFRIPIKEISCSCGPTLTRYEIKPEAGVRVRQIANLVDDISMTLAKTGVRIEAPIPGKAAVGIEVPNDKPAAVKLRSILEHADFVSHKSKLAACLGADVSGRPVVFDIEKMPHVLVAGTTGSGKSVCINSIIMSILYHAKPNEVKLLLVDPKQVEFQIYKDIPHLCCRIISNPKKAAGALNLAVNEMEKRFELIKEVGVRNITGYNEITKDDPEKPYMPRMVIIIDEFADLMMTAKEEVETAVVRIAQKARAAGIHLIIGTQRPSVDVITGLIKANIPSRIAFTVMSGIDSRTILDTVGAEKLCGRGDMLYAPVGAQKPQRVQGSFVSDSEVEAVVEWVKSNNAPVIYDNEFESQLDIEAAKCGNQPAGGSSGGGEFSGGSGSDDALLFEAAELAIDSGKIATSMLQRRLSVGYGRAAKIIDRLEEMGVVGPPDGTKPRQVLMSRDQLEELKSNME